MKRYNHKFSFISILVGIFIAFCFIFVAHTFTPLEKDTDKIGDRNKTNADGGLLLPSAYLGRGSSLTGFNYSKILPLSMSNQSIRIVRGASVRFTVKNYEIDESLIEQHRRDFPVNPDEGRWTEPETQDTHWLTLPADEVQGQLDNIKNFVTNNTGPNKAKVHVLETLDENSIDSLLRGLNLDKTLFIIISLSGKTAETNALAKLASYRGGNFVAITTTANDSVLMQFLSAQGVPLEEIQEHPDKVGGRYTFFSNVGMLPFELSAKKTRYTDMVTIGMGGSSRPTDVVSMFQEAGVTDIDVLLGEARRAMESDIKYKLGQFMFDMEKDGRKYMRIILPEKLAKLGPWIEQLVAESLGKHDAAGEERGIIAISERDFDPSIYANDDVFVLRIKLGESDERDGFTTQVVENGAPLFEFQLSSVKKAAFVMYSLEFATGMSGILMGIDPFNQPGVVGGKEATEEMKNRLRERIEAKIEPGMTDIQIFEIAKEEFNRELEKNQTSYQVKIADGITLDFGKFVEVLKKQHNIDFTVEMTKRGLDINNPKDVYTCILDLAKQKGKTYAAILPYDETFKEHLAWSTARALMRGYGFNDVFGIDPVYEHSYRQYFIQGPNLGVFTFIVSKDPGNLIIPDDIPGFTFSMQNALQALGTMEALVNDDYTYKISRRLAVRIEIDGKFSDEVMRTLKEFFAGVGRSGG